GSRGSAGGVRRLRDRLRRAALALLPRIGARRPGRQHHRQPGRAGLVPRALRRAGPDQPRAAGTAADPAGRKPGLGRRRGGGFGAPGPAAQPGGGPPATGRPAARSPDPTAAAAPGDPTDARVGGAPAARQASPVDDQVRASRGRRGMVV
ncbi:MAG: Hypothetical protein YaeJ with similarity to translation release factor, partial [uncultured Friedmanniella sp.]